jgi:hypothetical protein
MSLLLANLNLINHLFQDFQSILVTFKFVSLFLMWMMGLYIAQLEAKYEEILVLFNLKLK